MRDKRKLVTIEGVSRRNGHENTVWLNGKKLDPAKSQKVRNHSPDGFNWGYEGSGPAQLALAVLLEFTDAQTAQLHYQDFKRDVIAGLPDNVFELTIDLAPYLEKRS